jgi:hypothetical protein
MTIFYSHSMGLEEHLHSLHQLLDYLLLPIHHRFERVESFEVKGLEDRGLF